MRGASLAVTITAVVIAMLALAACGQGAAVKAVTKTVGVNSAGGASAAGTCKDVTSYDYNWNNDMLCTRSDGSKFYTDYAGADRFERTGRG
jgi:hypothetical protein